MNIQDPIVIDPPGFDCEKGWQSCKEEVDRCGGLAHDDGEPNWRAAFSADPGCCHCPKCHADYWAWGILLKCRVCDFVFPSNAWSMYSWGTQHHKTPKEIRDQLSPLHERRMAHPYYRYGHEHPTDSDVWETFNTLDWGEIFSRGYLTTDEFIDGAYRVSAQGADSE